MELSCSVDKPFQLMSGQILGVVVIGIIQFLAWVILIPVVVFLGSFIFGFEMNPQSFDSLQAAGTISPDDMEYVVYEFMQEVDKISWGRIIFLFVLFFIVVYLCYFSFFVSV